MSHHLPHTTRRGLLLLPLSRTWHCCLTPCRFTPSSIQPGTPAYELYSPFTLSFTQQLGTPLLTHFVPLVHRWSCTSLHLTCFVVIFAADVSLHPLHCFSCSCGLFLIAGVERTRCRHTSCHQAAAQPPGRPGSSSRGQNHTGGVRPGTQLGTQRVGEQDPAFVSTTQQAVMVEPQGVSCQVEGVVYFLISA